MSAFSVRSGEEVVKILSKKADTLIMFHRNPDADAVGSAFALRMGLEQMGSRCYCLCDSEVPTRLRFLMRGMQESVLLESLPKGFVAERIICVDTASPAQLGGLFARFENKIDLKIDHHAVGTAYADEYVIPTAGATGEILFDLFEELQNAGKLKCTLDICENLYAAINTDTGGFRFSNATATTFRRVAKLLEAGVDSAKINHLLYESKTMSQMRAEAAGVTRLQFFQDGKLSVILFPFELKKNMGLSDEDMETLIDVARCVAGVEVAVVIKQPTEAKEFRVSTRAVNDFDVAAVCAKFGGGGHKKAAGCTIPADSVEDAEKMLLDAVGKIE